MSKPSLTDFMTRPALTLKADSSPGTRPGKEVKNLTVRPSISQWEALVNLTTSERTKIQPYIIGLIADDFERRGLRWPE